MNCDALGPGVDFEAVAAWIAARPPRLGSMRLVAVDGPGGAGKSTYARRLADVCGARLVHTDDFASQDNPVGWWPRLEEQLLRPLAAERGGRYQRWDWNERALAEWHEVEPGGTLVLEGVSSARATVRDRLSFAIWIETPRAERLARGLARDGIETRHLWDEWMVAEDEHFEVDRTREHVDLIVSGSDRTDN
ncbi:uridine kinase family protein [Nocardia australiensis]|uniref:uridine kinase family protein n=1 Tax=Nocardia australiensis TaxID=2887191 RepID=UPI001D15149D|nr:(d)CMP kinase [Nocardia australiensis]